MIRRIASLLLVATSLTLTGCTVRGYFYPVQGPLAAQTPPPPLPARFTMHNARAMQITVNLPTGKVASGTFALLAAADRQSAPPSEVLTAQWDTIFGKGYYTANILGAPQFGRGVLTDSSGDSITVEAAVTASNNGQGPPVGVALDKQGNLFKIAF
jgi:hypothetical protein